MYNINISKTKLEDADVLAKLQKRQQEFIEKWSEDNITKIDVTKADDVEIAMLHMKLESLEALGMKKGVHWDFFLPKQEPIYVSQKRNEDKEDSGEIDKLLTMVAIKSDEFLSLPENAINKDRYEDIIEEIDDELLMIKVTSSI